MYKVLIIGAGKISAMFNKPSDGNYLTHCSGFYHDDRFVLEGIIDSDIDNAISASTIWNTNAYMEIEDFYNVCSADVVVIATPDETHYEIFMSLIQYKPKVVVLEKPVSLNLNESNEIKELADENDVRVIVNFSRRFYPEYKYVREVIRSESLGSLVTGTAYYGKGIIHNGSHLIDLLLYLFDNVSINKVYKNVENLKDDVTLSCSLFLNKDVNFNINAISSELYTIFEQEFLFTKGRVRFQNSGRRILIERIKDSDLFGGYKFLEVDEVIEVDFEQLFKFITDEVYDILGGKRNNISNLNNGIKGLELCVELKELYYETFGV